MFFIWLHNFFLFQNDFFTANIGFMMRDPAHFSDPEKFNPGRFLDAEGRYVKNERIVPFGIGM